MATHSSTLAWESPWTGEPGGLQSAWGGKQSDTTDTHAMSITGGPCCLSILHAIVHTSHPQTLSPPLPVRVPLGLYL